MKKLLTMLCVVFSFLMTKAQTAFTPGNLAVIRAENVSGVGNESKSTQVSIDEYTLDGTFVRSHVVPTTASGSNKALVFAGIANVEGLAALSPNRQYLTFCGYNTSTGQSSVGSSNSSTINRVVAVVDAAGNINTQTALDIFSSSSIRSSAIADNGTDLWMIGGNTGVVYITKNSTSGAVTVASSPSNARDLKVFLGQLYISTTSSSPANTRIGTVGTGLPTSTGNTVSALSGVNSSNNTNGFVLLDTDNDTNPDLLYVANETNGSIDKYSSSNTTTWTPQGSYSITGSTSSGTSVRGLTGNYNGGKAYLYMTQGNSLGNALIKVVDDAAPTVTINGTQTVLANADGSSCFKSVTFAPGTTDASLPVKLTSFNGKQQNSSIQLRWTTTSELNNSHFEVLKSTNGTNFQSLGNVTGHGTSNSINNYSFVDTDPAAGTNYYQLNQVDFNGASEKSNIIAVTTDLKKDELSAYISTDNQLNISLYSSSKGSSTLILTDLSGRRIIDFKAQLEKGYNKISQSLSTIQPGIYVLTVQKEGFNNSIKLYK